MRRNVHREVRRGIAAEMKAKKGGKLEGVIDERQWNAKGSFVYRPVRVSFLSSVSTSLDCQEVKNSLLGRPVTQYKTRASPIAS